MSSELVSRVLDARAKRWRLRSTTLSLGRRPLLMGIVNVTPDSFSDGGRFAATEAAAAHALRLVNDGADLIDIGGESTRPYAETVAVDDEMARVLPVIEQLACRVGVPLSIDTSKPEVAAAAMASGCEIINDVTGLADPRMIEVAAKTGAGVCAMHMQGTPQTMQDAPTYGDVVAEVLEYLRGRRDALVAAGIERERVCLDPGIGFGKTHEHNLALLANAWRLHELGCPVLIGHSRKGLIAKVIGDQEADRTAGTIGVALSMALQGVQVLRVHDVAAVRQALLLFEATGAQIAFIDRR